MKLKIHFKNNKNLSLRKDCIIISTLPITLTARLLGYKSNLKFRGIRTVYVLINKRQVLPKKVIGFIIHQKTLFLIVFLSIKK